MAPPSYAFELMRTAVLGLAARHPAVRSLINPRQTTAIAYVDSPLNGASHGFTVGPAPGNVLLECPVGDGFLTDLLCNEFTALYFGELQDAPELPCALRALPRAVDLTGRLYPMYGASQGSLYLVRPDGHVLARWHDVCSSDVTAAIHHALQESTLP